MSNKAQNAAKSATKPIEDALAAGKQTIEQAVKASAEGCGQAFAMNRDQAAQASDAMLRGYDDFAALNKQGVEALMKAGNIWAKGYEGLGKAYFSFAQASTERGVETAKAVMAAKTPQEAIDVQTDFAKQRFERTVAEGAAVSELSLKVAADAFQPLQKQFDVALSKLMSPVSGG